MKWLETHQKKHLSFSSINLFVSFPLIPFNFAVCDLLRLLIRSWLLWRKICRNPNQNFWELFFSWTKVKHLVALFYHLSHIFCFFFQLGQIIGMATIIYSVYESPSFICLVSCVIFSPLTLLWMAVLNKSMHLLTILFYLVEVGGWCVEEEGLKHNINQQLLHWS